MKKTIHKMRDLARPQNQGKFLFFFLQQKFCGSFEFCYFDGRSGLPSLCISAMILVALQNNSLIEVLCNRKYFLSVKLIFSVFIFSLDNFNYPNNKLAIPSNQRNSSAKLPRGFPQNFCGRKKTKTCLGFEVRAEQ